MIKGGTMPVKFQFVPTSGNLSGASFERQIEQAFNELGANIDDGNEKAQEAISTSNNALSVAQDALATAQSANTTAQEANATAIEAAAAVQGAYDATAHAQSRADEAFTLAGTAQGTANAAQTQADEAFTLAVGSSHDAQAALAAASSASAVSESALLQAFAASGIFTEDDEVTNLDDVFSTPRKIFVVDTEIPAPIPAPFYLGVSVAQTLDASLISTTQVIWSNRDPEKLFTRSAIITIDSTIPEQPLLVATWGNWREVGGGGGAILGELRLLPFRASELPFGWYFANGDQYPLTSPQGVVLNSLPVNLKTDWRIIVTDSNISLPKLFHTDGRGLFLRAANGTVRLPGSFQNESFKAHTHTQRAGYQVGLTGGPTPFNNYSSMQTDSTGGVETTPINTGVTPALFLGV